MVGVNSYSGDFEWITEGGNELKVVADAIGQALKWQGIIVPEKDKIYFCENGWQHGYIRPIEYSVFFILNI